jgi:hypothetical protein
MNGRIETMLKTIQRNETVRLFIKTSYHNTSNSLGTQLLRQVRPPHNPTNLDSLLVQRSDDFVRSRQADSRWGHLMLYALSYAKVLVRIEAANKLKSQLTIVYLHVVDFIESCNWLVGMMTCFRIPRVDIDISFISDLGLNYLQDLSIPNMCLHHACIN